VKVNSDNQPRLAYGHDHYQPGIAVDSLGNIGTCCYDHRGDGGDFASGRDCADYQRGGPFTNVNITSFAPVDGIDVLINPIYQGDYDGRTSDFTKSTPGFIGSFQVMGSKSNPDGQALQLPMDTGWLKSAASGNPLGGRFIGCFWNSGCTDFGLDGLEAGRI
jgi:hypothetical protein